MHSLLPRKLLLGILYLFAISLLAFFLSRQMPGDPAEIIANQGRENAAPPEIVEKIRQEYGFDKSWTEQYWLWLKRALLNADLGYSTSTRLPVVTEIKTSLPVTLQLGGVTFLITMLISFPLGLYAGVTRCKAVDVLVQVTTWINYSLPVFLVGNVFIWLFAVKYQLLPSIGHQSWKHFVLPVATLSLHLSGWTTQIIRSSVQEITGKQYVLAAKAKGLPKRHLVLVHILKPALLPIVTALLIQLGNLISGSFIIETVFAWNGVGRLLINAIMARDYPMIQGILLYVGSLFAIINILIDVLYLYLDPTTGKKLASGRRS